MLLICNVMKTLRNTSRLVHSLLQHAFQWKNSSSSN